MSDQNLNIGTGWPKDSTPKEPVNENSSAQRAATESESNPTSDDGLEAATLTGPADGQRGLFVEDVPLEEPAPAAVSQVAQPSDEELFVEDVQLEEPGADDVAGLDSPLTAEEPAPEAAVPSPEALAPETEAPETEAPETEAPRSEPAEELLSANELRDEQASETFAAEEPAAQEPAADLGSTQAFAAFSAAELAAAAAAKSAEADRLRAEADEVAAAAEAKAAEEKAEALAAEQAAADARAEEEERLRVEDEEMRERERQARDRKLGVVPVNTEAVAVPTRPEAPVTYKFWGALGLFILRLVTAAVVGVRGIQVVTDIPGTIDALVALNAPYAGPLAWTIGATLLVAAVMLVFGFGTRVAGAVLAVLGVLVLTFVRWGAFNIFLEGQNGFMGDFELLLVGVGLLLATLGGGGWGIDAGIHRGRLRRKHGV